MARCTPRRTAGSGYTLIELLIVVGVLGLAAALLVPSIGQPDTLIIQGAVRRLIGDISFAQSDALAQQENRRILFYDDGRGYILLRPPYDPDVDFIYDPLARTDAGGAYIVDFDQDDRFAGLTISSVDLDGGDDFLTFDELGGTVSNGGGPGTGGTIIIDSPNASYQITVAPFTGKLTVQKL
jgi:prepilin-type N-terminal cleavage/methylation domain-containing protein